MIDNLILSTDIIITTITLVEFHGGCIRRHVARGKKVTPRQTDRFQSFSGDAQTDRQGLEGLDSMQVCQI